MGPKPTRGTPSQQLQHSSQGLNLGFGSLGRKVLIERMLGRATTIAVLVNDEADVEPLALALNDRLEDISLAAVACKDGKVVGNDRDVRVFDIRHIKGLEFEAVFFVGLDETVAKHSELFAKFLYVGATRAANYLGVTFADTIPEVVSPLGSHFQEAWKSW